MEMQLDSAGRGVNFRKRNRISAVPLKYNLIHKAGAHLAFDGAAASSVLKRAIRARTGIAMSTAEKLFERAAILLLLVSGEEALRVARNEYHACINY